MKFSHIRNTLMQSLIAVAIAAMSMAAVVSCTPSNLSMLLDTISKATKVSQVITGVMEDVDEAQKAYFDRHPSMESEKDVKDALSETRAAVEKLNTAVEGEDEDQVSDARTAALGKYGDLRKILDERGILSGEPPAGGAETDAPSPQPFDMPTVEEVSSAE